VFIKYLIIKLVEKLFSVQETTNRDLGAPEQIILIQQHCKLYEVLTSIPLYRSLKQSFPGLRLCLIMPKINFPGKLKIKYADSVFVFSKIKLFNPAYILKLLKLLRRKYDVAIVPCETSFSHLSNFIARISDARTRIGIGHLNGRKNISTFLFDRRINIDWRNHPDSNVSERSLDILRPFGINTNNYRVELEIDENDLSYAEKFLTGFESEKEFIIGLNIGGKEVQCCWSLIKFCSLINKINDNYSANFYITGENTSINSINFIKKNINFSIRILIHKTISEIAAVISRSSVFISNDCEIMHIAGSTMTPQISVFGPTNPFNYAPVGANKYFIRKSELIDDVAVDDVYHLCELILQKKGS